MVGVFVNEGTVGLNAGIGVMVIGTEVWMFGLDGIRPNGDPCRDALAGFPSRLDEMVAGRGEVMPAVRDEDRIRRLMNRWAEGLRMAKTNVGSVGRRGWVLSSSAAESLISLVYAFWKCSTNRCEPHEPLRTEGS